MGSRDVPFDEEERCDVCGTQGAYDFYGDYFCGECAKKYISSEPCNRCGKRPCICGL